MGTRFELLLPAAPGSLDGPALRAAGEAAIDEIDHWHRRLNRFAADSLVSHLNRSAGRLVRLDRETFELLADALRVGQASAGAFDITVTPLLVRQGAADSAVPTGGGHVPNRTIELDPRARTVRFADERLSVDLGGIAKGHALDCAAAVLRDAGVQSALLHGGTSSILALGLPPGSGGWRVALDPQTRETVTLEDAALSLSDPAGQLGTTGRRHIVDPRAERVGKRSPAPETRVVVIGPSARLADAWSTALAVLGHVPSAFPDGYAARFIHHLDGATTHAIAAS